MLDFKLTSDKTFIREWRLEDLKLARKKRFLLKKTAIEFFFRNGKSAFLNFPVDSLDKIYSHLPHFLKEKPKNNYICKWQNYEISNLAYLMKLNVLASRSFNDYSQYPVVPWIIRDFISETLKYDENLTFRNLSRSMGTCVGLILTKKSHFLLIKLINLGVTDANRPF